MTEEWVDVGRPSYIGESREKRYKQWDEKLGQGKWRLVWKVGQEYVDFLGACSYYEDGYFQFLFKHRDVLDRLVREASEVYDDQLSNIGSGLDYLIQETDRTHVQDIAIRRCLQRMGLSFQGTEHIRIRQEKGTHPLSITLSPGRVPFHRPDLILYPEQIGWWVPGSIESFYQSNRLLQRKY